jgi:hypothetical protein
MLSALSAGLFISAALSFFVAVVPPGHAQATQPQVAEASDMDELGGLSAAAMTNDSGPAGIIPVAKGFNASMGTTSQHDSSSGWSSLLTPNVAYRLNRSISVDAGVPMYMYINIDANVGTKTKPVYVYSPKKGAFGDTSLSFHGDATAWTIDYNGTVSLGLPSGNTDYGLGAGQVTYNINNHFEKNFDLFTPDIEFGFGDTTTLVSQRVLKSYVAVGQSAVAHELRGGCVRGAAAGQEPGVLDHRERKEEGDDRDQHGSCRGQRLSHVAGHPADASRHNVRVLQQKPARPR